MSREEIDGGLRRLADSVWMMLAARLVSIVGVPLAAFLFAQLWDGVRETNAMLQALAVRMSVSEASSGALKERVAVVETELRELRRHLTGRP